MALSERQLWIRDINNLRRLGNTQMQNVANTVGARKQEVAAYALDAAAFGELYQLEQQIQSTYESTRKVLYEKLEEARQSLQDTASGLVKIADHYSHLERTLSH